MIKLDKDSDKLVVHAYKEQQAFDLPWYETVKNLSQLFDANVHNSQNTMLPNSRVKERLSDWYWNKWDDIRQKNRKLTFCNQIKEQPGFDSTLQSCQNQDRMLNLEQNHWWGYFLSNSKK